MQFFNENDQFRQFQTSAHLQLFDFSIYFVIQSTFSLTGQRIVTTKPNSMITKNKRMTGIVLTVALLLFIPLIAMQFTDEVNWTLPDFIVAFVLLLGTGLACELVIRKVKKTSYRITICVTILVGLLLIWAELAVGIFGTPFAGT